MNELQYVDSILHILPVAMLGKHQVRFQVVKNSFSFNSMHNIWGEKKVYCGSDGFSRIRTGMIVKECPSLIIPNVFINFLNDRQCEGRSSRWHRGFQQSSWAWKSIIPWLKLGLFTQEEPITQCLCIPTCKRCCQGNTPNWHVHGTFIEALYLGDLRVIQIFHRGICHWDIEGKFYRYTKRYDS